MEGPRFTVHENGSLEIYNVEKEDQGQYTCYTKNTEGSSAIDAVLDVKGILLRQGTTMCFTSNVWANVLCNYCSLVFHLSKIPLES